MNKVNKRRNSSIKLPDQAFITISLLILLFCCPNLVFSATRTSTATGGNWNSGSTWVGGVAPGTSDDIIIATSAGNSVTVTANAACNSLTINANSTLKSGNFQIQIKNAGTPFVITGTFDAETGTIYYSAGSGSVNIAPATYYNLRFGGNAIKNILDGVTVTGTFSGSGGAPTMTTGTFTISGPWTNSTAFVYGTGKVHYNGTGAIRANTYYDLEISGAGVKTMSGSITVNGTLTVNPGGQFQTGSASQLITLNKLGIPLVNNGTITSGILVYAGSGDQEMAGGSYNRIRLSGSGTRILPTGAVLAVANQFEVGVALEFQGNASAVSGGVLSGLGAMTMGTGTLTFLSTFTNTGLFTPGTGTVVYGLEGNQTINASTYHNLHTAGSGIKTFESGTTTVSGDFIIGSAATLASSTDLYIDGDITGAGELTAGGSSGLISLKGDWLHTGIFNKGTGVVIYEGINQSIKNLDYYTLQLSNGIKTISDKLTINGLLQINEGATLDLGNDTLDIAAAGSSVFINNGTLAGNGTVHFSSASTQTLPATTYPNLVLSGGAKTYASGSTIVVENDWNVNTTITISGSQNATIGGDILGSGDITQGSGTIRVSGDWLNSGVFTKGTGTVIFEGGTQSIPAYTYNNLDIMNAGVKSMAGDITVNGTLTIGPAAGLYTNAYQVTLPASGTPFVNDGTLSGTGTVNYTSTGNQIITPADYYNLVIGTGSRTVAGGTTIVVGNDLTVTGTTTLLLDGSLDVEGDIAGDASLTMNTGTISIAGDWTKTGAFNSNNGTVTYDGDDQQVAGLNYYDLAADNTGTKSLQGNTNIANTLLVTEDVSFDLGANTVNLAAAGTPLQAEGSLVPSTSTVNYSSSGETTVSAAEYYNLNISGGERIISPDGTVSIAGQFIPGAGGFTVDNSTINFNGTEAQIIPLFTFHRLILSGSDDKSILTAGVVAYDLEVQNSAVLNIEDPGEITITKP